MDLFLIVFIFIFGTVVGSFLNVLVDRLPRGEGVFRGRSYCENCKKKLTAIDLIPLFSFFLLGGKCRYCKTILSWYYPMVELTTGVLFVFVFLFTYTLSPLPYAFLYSLFIISALIVVFFTDLKYGIIPFSVVFPTIFIVFLYQVFLTPFVLPNTLFSAFGAAMFFLFLFLVTKGRGMGFGDVVYVFLMGFLLGFPQIVIGLYIAFLTGAIVSLILVVAKRKKLHGGIVPFGPFLVVGTIICLLWGQEILDNVWKYLIL